MIRRLFIVFLSLTSIGAAACLWFSSRITPGPGYNGWWKEYQLSATDWVGLRFDFDRLILWHEQPYLGPFVPRMPNARTVTNARFGFASSWDGCEIDGKLGVPFVALHFPWRGLARVVWFPIGYALAGSSFLLVAIVCAPMIIRVNRRRRNACIHCGYNLAGNVSGRCPECGADVKGT